MTLCARTLSKVGICEGGKGKSDILPSVSQSRVLRIVTEQYVTSLIQHNPKLSHIFGPLEPALYQSLTKVRLVGGYDQILNAVR